tara:strand:+ start:1666 stop:2178 length:513 start_codon:yes stop_codon:yes gene_type:complete
MKRKYFIGLGGNMGNRHDLLNAALEEIQLALPCAQTRSNRYETPAWGMEPGTPAFLNQVISIVLPDTTEPLHVLETLLNIEQKLGRHRTSKADGYQSRSIDLDVLAVEGLQMNTDELTLPHPRMHLRRFVLEPLAEIAPQLKLIEGGPTVAELLRTCDDQSTIQRLGTTL